MATMIEDNATCLFCHQPLDLESPPNLAFLDHLDTEPACHEDFGLWIDNVHGDFGGGD